jgi:hypothetical protein
MEMAEPNPEFFPFLNALGKGTDIFLTLMKSKIPHEKIKEKEVPPKDITIAKNNIKDIFFFRHALTLLRTAINNKKNNGNLVPAIITDLNSYGTQALERAEACYIDNSDISASEMQKLTTFMKETASIINKVKEGQDISDKDFKNYTNAIENVKEVQPEYGTGPALAAAGIAINCIAIFALTLTFVALVLATGGVGLPVFAIPVIFFVSALICGVSGIVADQAGEHAYNAVTKDIASAGENVLETTKAIQGKTEPSFFESFTTFFGSSKQQVDNQAEQITSETESNSLKK